MVFFNPETKKYYHGYGKEIILKIKSKANTQIDNLQRFNNEYQLLM